MLYGTRKEFLLLGQNGTSNNAPVYDTPMTYELEHAHGPWR
jgi:hypothetical protein